MPTKNTEDILWEILAGISWVISKEVPERNLDGIFLLRNFGMNFITRLLLSGYVLQVLKFVFFFINTNQAKFRRDLENNSGRTSWNKCGWKTVRHPARNFGTNPRTNSCKEFLQAFFLEFWKQFWEESTEESRQELLNVSSQYILRNEITNPDEFHMCFQFAQKSQNCLWRISSKIEAIEARSTKNNV